MQFRGQRGEHVAMGLVPDPSENGPEPGFRLRLAALT